MFYLSVGSTVHLVLFCVYTSGAHRERVMGSKYSPLKYRFTLYFFNQVLESI